MAFAFTPPNSTPFRPGSLFLGHSFKGHEIGLQTERHAITVAGSRSGKGASLIVPNLLRWPDSALVIDPKGENAHLTWQAREALGQTVHVLDPFHEADIPDRLRASFNPLATINPAARSAREDISVIADGLVTRYKGEDGEWYDGAVSILAGFIAHVLTMESPPPQNLASVRAVLNFPPDTFAKFLADMQENPACGGLAQTAATLCTGGTKSGGEYLSGARRSIDKFGADALRSVMAESTFALSDLKASRCTVFLVLPSRYVEEHARFFRLFVRLALNIMESPLPNRTGLDRLKGTPCLFILDEFFSLGRIDAIQKAAGRMAGNGVHIWPFVQDLGQLTDMYGPDGAHAFFGNSDAQIFFGNTDAPTLDFISARLGLVGPDEIGAAPIGPGGPGLGTYMINNIQDRGSRVTLGGINAAYSGLANFAHSLAAAAYQNEAMQVGRPRLAADAVRELVGKKDGDAVARSMIVFGKGNDVFNLRLAPYFVQSVEKSAPSGPSILIFLGKIERSINRVFIGIFRVSMAAVFVPFFAVSIIDSIFRTGNAALPDNLLWIYFSIMSLLSICFRPDWLWRPIKFLRKRRAGPATVLTKDVE